jgi:preprotein translocase subunit SecG
MIINLLLILVHVTVCLMLILVVLLQTGKRADLAGAFGGGGSQTAFGARGAATFLSKATTVSAAVFMLTSLTLAYRMGQGGAESSVLDDAVPVQEAPAPSETAPLPTLPEEIPGAPVEQPAIPGDVSEEAPAPVEDGEQNVP